MQTLRFLALAGAALSAAGCGMTPTIPGLPPYRIDIQQGNYLSQEMVSQLKPGMTREQVRFVLGTPLVTDIFHPDRWDYVYFRDPPGKPREQRRLSVFFDKEGRLVRADGDVAPAAAPQADAPKAEPVMPPKPVALPETKPVDPPPPTPGNWRTASDPEPTKPEPPREEPPKAAPPAAEAPKPAPAKEGEGERGFFGRMWDKVRGKD